MAVAALNSGASTIDVEHIRQRASKNVKKSTITAAKTIGETLSDDQDTQATINDFKNLVSTSYENGLPYEDLVEFLNIVKDAKSYTWHPTNSLSQEGTRLQIELIKAHQLPADIRDAAVKTATDNILNAQSITPAHKDTMLDEIDKNVVIANRDNASVNIVERAVEEVVEEIYGQRPDLSLNLAGRSWGPDADGKNNNEGWALLAWNLTMKKAMFQQVFDALHTRMVEYDVDLLNLRDDLSYVMDEIDTLYKKSRKMVLALAEKSPEDRQQYYEDHYQDLQNTKDEFRKIYEAVDPAKNDRGHAFYKRSLRKLDAVRHIDDMDPAIDEAYRTLKRNGFIFQKGQTRHNGIVYAEGIIDNLFAYAPFLESNFLDDDDRKLIASKEKFSDLTHAQQLDILDKASKDTEDRNVRKRLQEFRAEANPLTFAPNGYPVSEVGVNDRMEIRSITKRNYAEGIISDAGKISASQQHFLAKIDGMPDMKHMMLNEDQETLSMQAKLAVLFNKHGGQESAEFRHNNLDLVYRRGPDNEIRIMIPSSDSMRNGGPGTLMQMCKTIREATMAGIEMGVPVEIMLGSGGSMGRFGCDQGMVRRIVAQTLKEYSIKRGKNFDPKNKHDAAALRMAAVVMHTEQGRMPDLLSATPEQLAATHLSRITEMLEDRLELIGFAPDEAYIDARPTLKKEMHEKAERTWKDMIEEFSVFRFAQRDQNAAQKLTSNFQHPEGQPQSVLNGLARKLMCPNVRGFLNNSARAASKGGGKEILDERAIGNDKAKALAELFDSSFYSSGYMMERFYKAVNQKENSLDRSITSDDVLDLMDQPDWNFLIFAKGISEAGRFNAARNFEELSHAGKWNFDRAVSVGRSVKLVKTDPNDPDAPCELHYDNQWGHVSPEEAYLAKIYYDRLQFLALTEAALSGTFEKDIDQILQSFKPKDGSLDFGPGPKTLEKWPVAQTVLDNHRKNDDALALVYEVETYFEQRLKQGADRDAIIEELGGEETLRLIISAWNQGTLAHAPFWTGEYNYGLESRLETRREIANDNIPKPPTPATDKPIASA